ncbi:MAG: L,D-transpeptidase family protein [Hyphomicrobiaceae bacterium]|nr:L,D-transpeptidase family protein [Hyphomicrobiaceae bacterium]
MLRRLPLLAVVVGLCAPPIWAAEDPPSGATAWGGEASSVNGSAEASPAGLAPTAAGFGKELAERLTAPANAASTADREDRAALAAFYAAPEHGPLWVSAAGLTPAAQRVIAELRRADDWGLEASAFQLPTAPPSLGLELSRAQQADWESALSLAVLKYARHARGSRADPAMLSKFLDRKPPLLEPQQVMAAIAKADAPDAYLRSLHPQHAQFAALRQKYLDLRGGPTAPADRDGANAKPGQVRPPAVAAAGNVRKLLVNLEEWRWMPETLGDFYIWVNIPEFTLRVVKGGNVIHTERVVVGKRDTPTPVFSQNLEQIIFHPSWGVPESIKQQDVLPSLIRGSTRIFTFYHLRIQRGGRDIDPASIDWSTADIRNFHVYQPPGENNVLGNIKFRFPNKHDVYMHDTPQKNLFNADVRAFSHGCMRVRHPEQLAQVVLAEDQGWPANRVAAAVGPGGAQNNQITIERGIPVHITYFTAAVDGDGKLKVFADIYDHESKIALGLEGKAHLIPRWKEDKAPARAEAIGSLAEASNDSFGKKDWARRALSNPGGF